MTREEYARLDEYESGLPDSTENESVLRLSEAYRQEFPSKPTRYTYSGISTGQGAFQIINPPVELEKPKDSFKFLKYSSTLFVSLIALWEFLRVNVPAIHHALSAIW